MRFQCPLCKGVVSVDNADMGTAVQCGHCNNQITVPESRTASGSVIGDFIILRELGRGGMGVVFQAHQISLDRPAALKILADSYANDSEFVVGFIKEARAAAKLNHPNIVQAYAVGDDEGVFYFAMEHVDGETMKDILKQKKVIPYMEAVGIIQQIAEALDYAWKEEKLVHRDIKPDNIMLTSSGRAKLADLGLAKVGDDSDGSNDSEEVMGTPQYISPEQLTGDPLDNRTDIYSLGATFYHFLTGRFPYEGADAVEITRQHLYGTLVPVNQVNPEVPESLARIVEKMMAKDPNMRYQSAGDLAEDLTMIKRGMQPLIATETGVIKVQTSNRTEASMRPVPPKLQLRKLNLNKKLNLKSPAAATSEQQTSVQPAVPAVQETQKAAEEQVKTDVTPEKTENTPPLEEPEKTQEIVVVEEPPKKSRKKLWIVSAVILILLLLLGGGTVSLLIFGKDLPFIASAKTSVTQVVSEWNKGPSPFMKEAPALVTRIQQEGTTNQSVVFAECVAFLNKSLIPVAEEEKNLYQKILEYYTPIDEEPLEQERQRKISSYYEQQENKIRQERIARQKAKDEEAKRKIEQEKQKYAAAEKNKVIAAKNAEKAKQQREFNNYKNQILQREKNLYLDMMRYSQKNNIQGFREKLQQDINEKPENRAWANLSANLKRKAIELKRFLEKGWEWDTMMADGIPAILGSQIDFDFNLYTISEIKNEQAVLKDPAGKSRSVPISKLLGNRTFRSKLLTAGYKMKKVDGLLYYYFWHGMYKEAHYIIQDAEPAQQKEFSRFVSNYLKEAYAMPSERGKLSRNFSQYAEYQQLLPRPKPKPQVKRAPVKTAPKKVPPKKPASKPASKK